MLTGPDLTEPIFNREEIRPRANALFQAEQSKDLRAVIAQKIGELQHYDVRAMERVVAVLPWGRSGSLLLASYLDGHDNVLMLADLSGSEIYRFFEYYGSWPLRDKLLGYPAFTQSYFPMFGGPFAISRSEYYAAVQAILEFYSEWPPEFLSSRRTFFLFVHIAYNLALGRRPPSSPPLIVYAQHFRNPVRSRQLVEDFPQAKFIHAIRDPITLSGQILADRTLPREPSQDSNEIRRMAENESFADDRPRVSGFRKLADLLRRWHFGVLSYGERPVLGMESRTMAVRFEDLHCNTAETMRDLCEWLGLSYQATLLDSTFNGIPWVVTRDGKAWSGSRPEQAQRNLRYISPKDQALLFAMFYKNLVAWNYPCPKIFGNQIVRWSVFATLFLVPTKVEIMAARALFKSRILPSVRRGKISIVVNSLLRIVFYRMAIIWLFVREFGRYTSEETILQVDFKSRSTGTPR